MTHSELYSEFKELCIESVRKGLTELNLSSEVDTIALVEPSSPEHGELATTICFELARKTGKDPLKLAKKLLKNVRYPRGLVERVEVAGSGYINFKLNFEETAPRILDGVLTGGPSYGLVKVEKPEKVMVEHTSVNPIHPIHVGQARNPVLGDALARLLKHRGHHVKRHYYVDDMGRQSALLAYGYRLLGEPEIEGKPDHLLGELYSVTSCLVEIESLKGRVRSLSKTEQNEKVEDEIRRLTCELDDWVAVAAELRDKYPEIFEVLSESIMEEENPELEVARLIKDYEAGKGEAKRLIRKVSNSCLEGFKDTLEKLGIGFDSWDWESDILWSGKVNALLDRLKGSPYVRSERGALELNAEEIVDALRLRDELGLSESYNLPSLTLIRSDGTTLYTTRDIAYSLQKFEKADKVINVIGMEQSLAQIQLKAALHALGEDEKAGNLTHFAFGLVEMPGHRMSSRRGRVITLDKVLEEALARAYKEVHRREKAPTEDESKRIAERIGIASVKYALLSVEPIRTVTFTWDRVLDFEKNSAPFINYAYTRTLGILRKFGEEVPSSVKGEKLTHPLEHRLLLQVAKFPEIVRDAADNLKPNEITNFANNLAELFHEYYEKVNVLGTADEKTRLARTSLIKAVSIVTRNAMNFIGIELSEKM